MSYLVEGNIPYLELHTEEKEVIKNYLPEYSPKIIIKNSSIKTTTSKTNYITELKGLYKVNNNFDTFDIKKTYNSKNKSFNGRGDIDLTNM